MANAKKNAYIDKCFYVLFYGEFEAGESEKAYLCVCVRVEDKENSAEILIKRISRENEIHYDTTV